MGFALTKFARAAFTLVEIMIAVAVIALLAAIAIPGFLRARIEAAVRACDWKRISHSSKERPLKFFVAGRRAGP
jgi:prepilin-type N-terminal cleavage/methylation domain-containing protein